MKFCSLSLVPALGLMTLSFFPQSAVARGGGGGGGGHFEGGGGGGDFRDDSYDSRGENVNFENQGANREDVQFNNNDGKSANAEITREGSDTANVNVHTDRGDYDTTVTGPDGYRNGYIYRDGGYVQVGVDPFVPYVAPFGPFAGWSIVTEPAFTEYPVYATYPVETAVQVKLAQLGFYNGPVDGILGQTTEAIIAYQQSQNLEATGQINVALLDALGIKRS